MSRRIGEVMTAGPRALPLDATLYEAARIMRDQGIGDVLVTLAGRLCGVITDRDIVVRGVADNRDPAHTPLSDVCTAEPITLGPDDDTDTALRLMREEAVRRLPVVDDQNRPLGIVSIGDLVIADGAGANVLCDISRAPPSL
ncbi:CBS domain-containing protein [Actinomadura rugatobispora]|uniref:CBS domain-containing protein n=1 Tax=Actinomadura rugatobispora TaxID=1994 RepID=A0ABW1ACL6_9ACTN|nr:CBS domain-containing protein [Actinomadura rugatobispora]